MQVDDTAQGRSEVLSCRCTRLEAHLIRTLAAKEDATLSDFLRTAALAGVGELGRELASVLARE